MVAMKVVQFMVAGLALYSSIARADDRPGETDDQDIEEESLSDAQLHALHGLFDHDQNGKVSLQEVMRFAGEMTKNIAGKDIKSILEEIDANKDGKLSLSEHLNDIHNQAEGGDEEEMAELTARKNVETEKFKAADGNNDGFLDETEVPALFYPETHDDVLSVTVRDTMRQKDANKDGRLNAREFWEADAVEGDDLDLSQEEQSDFEKLDTNGDGFIDKEELKQWESGRFHTEESMKQLFELADANTDLHLTADELINAREQISISDAQYHLIEWSEHNEL